MYLKAGDLVVCINADVNPNCQPNPPTLDRLKKGMFYRVATYIPVSPSRAYWGGKPINGVQLVGIDHSPGHGWQAWRFRKVVSADGSFSASLRERQPADETHEKIRQKRRDREEAI